MSDSIDATDVAIVGQIREMYSRLDPPPAGLDERLKFRLTVQQLHADVAELTDLPLLASRALDHDDADRADTVTFTSQELSLMVSLCDRSPDSVSVDGWVTRGGAHVELQSQNQVFAATADEHGRFRLEAVPTGSGNFIIWPNPEQEGDRPIITPTIEL